VIALGTQGRRGASRPSPGRGEPSFPGVEGFERTAGSIDHGPSRAARRARRGAEAAGRGPQGSHAEDPWGGGSLVLPLQQLRGLWDRRR